MGHVTIRRVDGGAVVRWNVIVPVVKRYPQAMDDAEVSGYLAVVALTHSPARVQA
ncbi:hypothetical protein M2427_003985 [Bradyrhizobium sp. BR13661]|jgi:hypothetical protein|nr:hypothetical protein [Bradyrhizobium sp. BR13661]